MPRRDVQLVVPIVDWRAIEDRVCIRKREYPTAADARHARADLVHRTHDAGLKIYPCPFHAGHWHIGHPPDLAGLRRIAAALRSRAAEQDRAS